MQFQQFLKNLQAKPEATRKTILWSVVICIGIIFMFVWLTGVRSRVKKFQQLDILKQAGVPELQQKIDSLPKVEMPEIKVPELSEEELNVLNSELQNSDSGQNVPEEVNP